MACRKFLKSYRGNVVARQYDMSRLKYFQQMQSRVNGSDEEPWNDAELEWVEVEASSVPLPGHAPALINLPLKSTDRATDGMGNDTRPVAVFNVDGELYAMDSRCPHMGGPLEKGSVAGSEVSCPWHRWRINVKTGCVGNISDMEDLVQPTFWVKREGGRVLVCTRPKRIQRKCSKKF